eukprot:94174_1
MASTLKLSDLSIFITAARANKSVPKYIHNIEDDKNCIQAQLCRMIMSYIGIDLGYNNNINMKSICAQVYFKTTKRRFGWTKCKNYIGTLSPNMNNLYIIDSLNSKFATLAVMENYKNKNPRRWCRPLYEQKIPKKISSKQTYQIEGRQIISDEILKKIVTISFGNKFCYMIDNKSHNMIIADKCYKKIYNIPLQRVSNVGNISIIQKFKTNNMIRCIWSQYNGFVYMVTNKRLYKITSNSCAEIKGFDDLNKCKVFQCKNSCFYYKGTNSLFLVCLVSNGIDLRIIDNGNNKGNKKKNVSFGKKYENNYKLQYLLHNSKLLHIIQHKYSNKNCFTLLLRINCNSEEDALKFAFQKHDLPISGSQVALFIKINFKSKILSQCYMQCVNSNIKNWLTYDNKDNMIIIRDPHDYVRLQGYDGGYHINCEFYQDRKNNLCRSYDYDVQVVKIDDILDNFEWISLL